MGESPLVSVITCTYNAGQYLCEAIASVLEQTYEPFELIVVDDGSTDGSVAGAERRFSDGRIRWLRQANAGKSVALNRALREAKGEFYVIQDADDASHPRRVERLVSVMLENAGVAAVYSGHELILNGRRVAPRARAKCPEQCRRDIEAMRMPAHDPTGMYRLSLVRGIEYDQSLRIGQGYDYVLRVGERWPMMVVGECLYGYRVHGDSVTRADPERRERLVMELRRRGCERRGLDYEQWRAERVHARRKRRGGAAKPGAKMRAGFQYGLAPHFMESAVDQRRDGRFLPAVRTGLQCSRLRPWSPRYHQALAYALCPPALLARLRRNG